MTKIFNKNDYNVEIDGQIYGLSNDNLGLNSKKPYLEKKTRKMTIPYLITPEEAIRQRKFFDYLMNKANAGETDIFFDYDEKKIISKKRDQMVEGDFSGYFLKIQKGKELEIHHQDTIVDYKYFLKKKFLYRNVIGAEDREGKYKEYVNRQGLQEIVNEVFYSKWLTGNYFTPEDEMSIDGELKRILIWSREAVFAWLYKGREVGMDGTVYGSDKALKYPMKKMWDDEGKKVLYIKSMKFGENNTLIPKSIKERYEDIFHVDKLEDAKDGKEVLTNLLSAVDVKNFGATFAEPKAKVNVSITGAVQFGQGFNKYEGTTAEEQQILSPFRDAKDEEKKEEAKNSTLGTKITSNEAHYFYPFVINPMTYKEWIKLGVTEGYTEEDYQNFKRTALVATTSYATNAKEGCENEFAIFVETDPDLYLPNLSEYITFKKEEEINVIDISDCTEILSAMKDRIKNVEVYYNPYTTKLVSAIEEAKIYNIVTQKEV